MAKIFHFQGSISYPATVSVRAETIEEAREKLMSDEWDDVIDESHDPRAAGFEPLDPASYDVVDAESGDLIERVEDGQPVEGAGA